MSDDQPLIRRVRLAYAAAADDFAGTTSFWDTTIGELKRPIDAALRSPDAAQSAEVLRHPERNVHFWGFDAVCKAPDGQIEPHEQVLLSLDGDARFEDLYAAWLHDALISLGDAVGARRIFYPETKPVDYGRQLARLHVDDLLDDIEAAIRCEIRFPNPYGDELGLDSRRGIIGFRSLQSLYQAWRLWQLADGRPDFRVIEIGAGLGRTAFFALQFGLRSYTIVDLPLTNAAQGYFLGRVLGQDRISLYQERGSDVRVLPPNALSGLTERFDLMLNVDSFTEMSLDTMQAYWRFGRGNANAVLSINHEINPATVHSLFRDDASVRWTRHPYWMRRGYVEEYLTW